MSELVVSDLVAGYGGAQVLHGVSLSVGEGEICAILGPNGAGKTTLLRALSGVVKGRGSVRLDGSELLGRSPDTLARQGVAHVPEGRGTFMPLTVEENLRLGAYTRKAGVEADLERVCTYFPALRPRLRQVAGSLSGGEQQMLAIARALMSNPKLLLLDEPSLGLAPIVVRQLFDVLARVCAERAVSMVVVEQNAALALGMAQRGYVLEAGEIAVTGEAHTLRDDENVRRAYLGY